MENKEPYRATKLWNEVILAFQHGMPIKKHRRKMHTYSDCFMASNAVTWLHCYLMNNPNFGSDVTRQQTINLLGKFLKCHVIECVSQKLNQYEFSDNSHLYRFTKLSPQQLKACPLQPVASLPQTRNERAFEHNIQNSFGRCHERALQLHQKENIPECLFVERKMTLSEIEAVWKSAVLERLQNEIQDLSLNDILSEKFVNGHVIKHNICRISRTGVVSLIDKTDDIPHWVVSAMKCLSNWPNASGSGSCLPNYPGFEKDVFKVVRDFFINTQIPLISSDLCSAFSTMFSHFLHDQLELSYDSRQSKKNIKQSDFDHVSLSSAATKIETSTPVLNTTDNIHLSKSVSSENSHGKLLLDDPEVMWDYPSTVYYETDFAKSDPVTTMVSSLSDSKSLIYNPLHVSTESVSTISMCSMKANLNSGIAHNPSTPLKAWNSDPCIEADRKVNSQTFLQEINSTERIVLHRHSMFDYLSIPFADNDSLNDSTCSSKTIVPENDKQFVHSFDNCEKYASSAIDNQNNFSAKLNESSPCPALKNSCVKYTKQFENFTYPDQLKKSVQLLLLFLLPPNRRQLHLLLRVMNKILKNKKFVLDIKISMRDYLLLTFLPAIIPYNNDPVITYGIVSLLLDNCELLFTPPLGLKEQVEKMCRLRNGKIVYSVDDACYLTYCEMVSKQQYEEQKVSISHEALKNLLVSIIQNKSLSDKERKKRIKQFKGSHPDVYFELFPGKPNFERSKSSFLSRFANLRI